MVAALSLGLGIGANATIFSIINATLPSDLPYPDVNRLVVLWTAPLNRPGIRNNVTARNYLAWKGSQSVLPVDGWTVQLPPRREYLAGQSSAQSLDTIDSAIPQHGRLPL
jgi:hypothetical protein